MEEKYEIGLRLLSFLEGYIYAKDPELYESYDWDKLKKELTEKRSK